MAQTGANSNLNHKDLMNIAVMCTLNLYDVIGITRHVNIKLKSFSNGVQSLINTLLVVVHF